MKWPSAATRAILKDTRTLFSFMFWDLTHIWFVNHSKKDTDAGPTIPPTNLFLSEIFCWTASVFLFLLIRLPVFQISLSFILINGALENLFYVGLKDSSTRRCGQHHTGTKASSTSASYATHLTMLPHSGKLPAKYKKNNSQELVGSTEE